MVADWKRAMEIDWMSRDELAQAIPPAYTQFIGEQLLSVLADRMTA
jgi:DNA (cytosine-5)-methyltransferase 1